MLGEQLNRQGMTTCSRVAIGRLALGLKCRFGALLRGVNLRLTIETLAGRLPQMNHVQAASKIV
jgi:hypothetical protein